jgi:dTMP kinase
VPLDRLELEGPDFFERIADAYRSLAESDPERIRIIDAGQRPEAVLEQALNALDGLL